MVAYEMWNVPGTRFDFAKTRIRIAGIDRFGYFTQGVRAAKALSLREAISPAFEPNPLRRH
jgi:hypothetical protein